MAPETAAAPINDNNKKIFKTCGPFTNCIIKILMYNLIVYSDNYLKTPGILWQFYRDVPAVAANANTRSSNLKVKLTGKKGKNGIRMLK